MLMTSDEDEAAKKLNPLFCVYARSDASLLSDLDQQVLNRILNSLGEEVLLIKVVVMV